MATIQPISTGRVTDAMTRNRLNSQIQGDQLDLFRLQNQLSTGFRIFLPSDDAPAAQRAMVLQRTIERKTQSLTNLEGVNSSLTTTLGSLQSVNDVLNTVKSAGLSAIDTIASPEERDALVNEIDEALFRLQSAGNATFATNFLLGGAEQNSDAYQSYNGFIEYLGDESSPQSFVDIGLLFDAGVSGDEVLGGLSEAVRGSVDLNLQLTPETPLSRLNGGLGVTDNGSIEITFVPTTPSAPTTSSVIDLSGSKTIEDVARLIETSAPEGSGLTVSIEGDSLRIDAVDGGVTINEVGNGSAARELGILTTATPTASVAGSDLDPTIDKTDALGNLLGSKARGRIVAPGVDNDLVITATENGVQYNGVTVNYVDGAITAGDEVASYDSLTNTLTVTIDSEESNAQQIAAAINAEGTFFAEADFRDQTSLTNRGLGEVTANATADLAVGVAGGVDGEIDLDAGLLITNGDATYTIDTSAFETVEDLLSELNRTGYGLSATINASNDGIDVRTRRSGADFAIAENGGTTAADLGIRTYTESSRLDEFNRGVGVIQSFDTPEATLTNNAFQITLNDQGAPQTFDIDLTNAQTVQDVLDGINAATAGAVTASLATTGNGIVLTRNDAVDAAAAATGDAPTALNGAGDTLTIASTTNGPAGNGATFTVEVIDTGGSGGLSTTVTDGAITVDLGGTTPTSAAIATSIQGQLAGYTVNSSGTDPVTAPVASQAVTLAGGFDADNFSVTGQVAERLGFLPEGEDSATSAGATLSSTDRKPLEVDSVFTTLIRMRDALTSGDDEAFEREVDRLDEDIQRVTFGRAEIGTRLQNLEAIKNRLADEDITLRGALSNEIDADLVQVISDFTAKQASLQASLQTSGALLGLSILDFI